MAFRWKYVNEASHCLRLPGSTTGARVVHLGQPALNVLASITCQLGNA